MGAARRWPPPVYRIVVDFDAPLEYVFAWCTDYRPEDGRGTAERHQRWILSRTSERVVLEDLWTLPDGWGWRRSDVTLAPPDRWHVDSVGTVRDASIDYRLTRRAEGRTQLTIQVRRRPSPIRPEQPTRARFEGPVTEMWRGYARALARDYRAGRPRSPRRGDAPRRRVARRVR
jgi:hypothetical protein